LKKTLSILLLIVLSAAFAWTPPVHAVGPWSEPLLINHQDAATPFILADPSGTVHVFWGSTGLNRDRGAIFYRRLTDGIWSETVDIIAPPGGDSALFPSAIIDGQGYIHLVWVSDKLYYSQAHISLALHPRGWSTPYQMTNYGATNGVIQLGRDGSVNVLFGSQGANPAVYLLKSEDGGDFWQIAIQVSMPENSAYALTCSLAIDSSGRLHAAWTEALQTAALEEGVQRVLPSGVYYARSDDGGYHWSYPRTIAGKEQGDPAIGVDDRDRVHLFWSGTGSAAGKYHTYLNPQSGEWQDTERILSGGEGLLGMPALAFDSSGRLYVAFPLTSQTLFTLYTPGEIVALRWWDGRWGEDYQVSLNLMDDEIEHSHPALTISGGNQLHLVWTATDLRHNQEDDSPVYLWYATLSLGSPAIEPVPVPTLEAPLATTTPEAQTTIMLPTPTPWEVTASGFLPPQPIWYKQAPVLFGGFTAFLIIAAILYRMLSKKDHAS
jgi:hypothetical protein